MYGSNFSTYSCILLLVFFKFGHICIIRSRRNLLIHPFQRQISLFLIFTQFIYNNNRLFFLLSSTSFVVLLFSSCNCMGQLHKHVGLNVHGRADSERVQIRPPVGERQNGDGDFVAINGGDREADAFDGDGAFVDHPLAEIFGNANLESPIGGLAVEAGAGSGMTGSSAVRMPVPSTWPWTMWPPRGLPAAVGSSRLTL